MIYIALLRGINIGPHKRMKMEKLAACCAACGFRGARTYLQSGNVVFATARSSGEKLARKLEAGIVNDFGFSADVICRTREEMEAAVAQNPLARLPGLERERLHVVFLERSPTPAAISKLRSLTLAPDRVEVADREVYFYFPNGVSGSSLWKHPLDRVLQVPATMRNWNTVNRLLEMARERA